MINGKVTILITAICLLGLSACSDFLDIQPYGQTIPKTAEEFEALLHSRLDNIDYAKSSLLINDFNEVFSLEAFADNLDASLTDFSSSTMPLYIGSSLLNTSSKYSGLYEIIRDCNIIIDELVEDQTDLAKNVLGTAYAIRGVAYYRLMTQFCEPVSDNIDTQLGLPLVYTFDMEYRPTRSSLKQTISQIEADLKKALSYKVTDEIYRFTEDVVQAYLAKLYFWTRDWNSAIAPSELLLQKYPLLSGEAYTSMISERNTRSGNILIRSYLFGDNSTNFTYTTTMQNVKKRPVSKELVDLFDEKEKDIRFALSFNKRRENLKNLLGSIRTDEMCLILAESYAHLGNEERALHYLNLLREKRISDYVPFTMENLPAVDPTGLIKEDAEGKALTPLMYAILNERRKEFYMEGDRWFELKRNGRPEFWVAKDGYKWITMKFMYTFPLPVDDILIIDGLIQNPGYEF